jgi:hypothetical protein
MTLSITILGYYAECHYAECRILFTIMLNVIMLSAIMLSVVMLSVLAPRSQPLGEYEATLSQAPGQPANIRLC